MDGTSCLRKLEWMRYPNAAKIKTRSNADIHVNNLNPRWRIGFPGSFRKSWNSAAVRIFGGAEQTANAARMMIAAD